jgi:hypothetical protein
LSGCAYQPETNTRFVVSDWQEMYHLQLPYQPAKCLYSMSKDTAYILNKETARIDIFKKGKKQNSIGGRGLDNLQFTQLSDIALAADGTIYTLDSFEKKIKRFDENGGFVSQFQLSELAYPTLFDVISDEVFYIFDEDKNEIAIVRRTGKPEFFGKFSLQKPTLLIATNNMITIYDETTEQTLFFSLYGKLLEERNGFFMQDKRNYFQLKTYFVEVSSTKKMYAISPVAWRWFLIKSDTGIFLSQNSALIGRFFYETKN